MTDDRELNAREQRKLLEVARHSVAQAAAGQPPDEAPVDLAGLDMQRGAFVTLHKRGQLRGCIGNFVSDDPLVDTVRGMAVAAATQDPRFPPVRPEEMADLDVEISVLSPLRQVDSVEEIEVGRHGIYIISPRGRGVLLPQVATEYGWDRDTFLDQTCVKAGLRPGCWRDPDTRVMVFTAQIFGEEDLD